MSDSIIETQGVVEPQLAVSGDAVVIAWAHETDGVHVARSAQGFRAVRHASPSAAIRLAAGGGRVWAVWDAGAGTNCGCSYHQDGVNLMAAAIEGDELLGELVSDQLWTHCYGKGYAIAVGPDGAPRIAYVVRERVYHARRDGAQWTVEKGPLAERETIALAIDARGRSHVVFERDHVLCHAVQDAGTWKQTRNLTQKYETYHPTIATDAESRPHLAYMSTAKSKDQLWYATQDGDVFTAELVDKKGNAGAGARIAIDADGTPWINYRAEHSRENASARRIAPAEHRLAVRRGGVWKTELVTTGGSGNSFALDGATPVIAAAASTRGGISLVRR